MLKCVFRKRILVLTMATITFIALFLTNNIAKSEQQSESTSITALPLGTYTDEKIIKEINDCFDIDLSLLTFLKQEQLLINDEELNEALIQYRSVLCNSFYGQNKLEVGDIFSQGVFVDTNGKTAYTYLKKESGIIKLYEYNLLSPQVINKDNGYEYYTEYSIPKIFEKQMEPVTNYIAKYFGLLPTAGIEVPYTTK